MATRKKPVELSKASLKLVLKETGVAVRAANLGRGIAMTFVEGNELIELQPDGSRRVLRNDMPAPVRLAKQRFTLD